MNPDSPAIDPDYPLGEDPSIRERVVVSPALGVFEPAPPVNPLGDDHDLVRVGMVVGWVDGQEVRSPFTGRFMGLLAPPGSWVVEGEPVAWLRT